MKTNEHISDCIDSYLELEYPYWRSRMKKEAVYLTFLEEFYDFYRSTMDSYIKQGDREDIAHEQAYRDMIYHVDMDYQTFDDRVEHLN